MTDEVRPDVKSILGGLKDFQRQTVDYVYERMYGGSDPQTRFLVADEVGLGKTLVARGIVARAIDALWDEVPRIDVIYICSNGDIARQNVRRLNVSSQEDFALASRITLLPTHIGDLKKRKLNFVSFTPRTSLDTRSQMGISEERALLYWLLHSEWGFGRKAGPLNVLQGTSTRELFREEIRWFDRTGINKTLMRAFHARLTEHDRRAKREGRPGLRERFDELGKRFNRSRLYHRLPERDKEDRRDLVSDLRAVLAASCVTALEPDIVILDEFQRFKELLDPDPEDDAGKLANELFAYSDRHTQARVLLLSATPYKMYTVAHDSSGDDHYKDFVSTLRFLFHDEDRSEELEELLTAYRQALLQMGSDGQDEVARIKEQLEIRLRQVMVRTERLAVSDDRNGMLQVIPPTGLTLEPGDVRSYLRIQRIARELENRDVLEYWKSAPYLYNFMEQYVEKRELRSALNDSAREPGLRELIRSATQRGLLPWSRIERFRKVELANPRLRQLNEQLIGEGAWRFLWIPPSLPYYELRRPFHSRDGGGPKKRLAFSSWAVVPKAAASLLTFEAEREMYRSSESNPTNTAKAREARARPLDFRRQGGRLAALPVLGLSYASLTLAEEVDPLAISLDMRRRQAGPRLSEVVDVARKQVRRLLNDVPVSVTRGGPVDDTWYWAAPMLIDLACHRDATIELFRRVDAVSVIAGGEVEQASDGTAPAVAEHVDFARQLLGNADADALKLGRKPPDLDRVLALQAVSGLGTSSLRALARLVGFDELADPGLREGAGRIASSLRSLFNVPEAIAMIRGLNPREPYWLRVLEYSAGGCLQAVLDEYAHVLVEAIGLIDEGPAEVAKKVSEEMSRALALRPSLLGVDEIGVEKNGPARITKRTMRARFATRFGVDDSDEAGERTRADQVRTAFNSPFWPFALISTSVGQEGLDFHLYCHAVVHWNLPSNPVDLEQREGRIHRYKGHAVRKNLAKRYGLSALNGAREDPWTTLFERARRDRHKGDNDLIPYWIYPVDGGAKIERHVPALPMSRDTDRYERLCRSLAIYRMAFGQPRQDDLVGYLLERLDPDDVQKVVEELRIDLSPAPTGAA